jgi:spore maturation protein CgeB
MKLDVVIFGLAITSSWGNGHAVTYRALVKALRSRGHTVTFIERDVPWYREHRDLENPDYCRVELYKDLKEVGVRFSNLIAEADLVILGSYVPDGAILADWITSHARGVTAFYDIDTPVTLANLNSGAARYISAALIPRFDLYLSFTGGPALSLIEDVYGSPRARALYCAADLEVYSPCDLPPTWTLGYLGTYSADRQPALEQLLLKPARKLVHEQFVVAGPQYPASLRWPANVTRIEHLSPCQHPKFYGRQRYTLNLTRADMVLAGYSPSVRMFEAAACGVPIITDRWPGIESIFKPGEEVIVVESPREVIEVLRGMQEQRRRGIAAAARKRLIANHTPRHRAIQLEDYYREVIEPRGPRVRTSRGAERQSCKSNKEKTCLQDLSPDAPISTFGKAAAR